MSVIFNKQQFYAIVKVVIVFAVISKISEANTVAVKKAVFVPVAESPITLNVVA